MRRLIAGHMVPFAIVIAEACYTRSVRATEWRRGVVRHALRRNALGAGRALLLSAAHRRVGRAHCGRGAHDHHGAIGRKTLVAEAPALIWRGRWAALVENILETGA